MRIALGLAVLSTFLAAAGPEAVPEAPEVLTKVKRVVVYSDRARITRTGSIAAKEGRQRVVVSGLPVAVNDGSVSAALPGKHGARILSIEVETAYGKRTATKEAEALIAKMTELEKRDARIADELAALSAEESFLRSITVKPRTDEKGRPLPLPLEPGAWQSTLDFVSRSLADVLARTRAKQAEQEALGKEIQALSLELDKVRSYESEAMKRVALEVDAAKSGSVDLEITYSLVGPSWRPAYDVRVLSSQGKVEITTQGVVRQSTGEDWRDVELVLSTAFPEQGADVPELLAWRLGDAQQFAYAAGQGGTGSMGAGDAVLRESEAEESVAVLSKESRRSSGGKRSSKAARAPVEAPAPASIASEYAPDMGGEADGNYDGRMADEMPVAEPAPMPKPPSPPARVAVRDRADKRAEMQPVTTYTLPVGSGTAATRRNELQGYLTPRGRITVDVTRNALVIQDEANNVNRLQTLSQQMDAQRRHAEVRQVNPAYWSLPAGHQFVFQNSPNAGFTWSGDVLYCPSPRVASGGFDFSFKPDRKQTVLSDGRERKVKLATNSFPAQLQYEVVAPLSPKAYLRASVKNDTRMPFLAGESFVFLDDDFVGRAFIGTVAPRENVDLSLGIDEDVKIDRRVEQSAEGSGLITKKERTVYTVLLAIRSFKKRPVEVIVRDQIPITWQKDDLSVETLTVSPDRWKENEKNEDTQGLLAWKLTVPPGGKSDIKIKYAVEKPRDFDVVERRN